MNVKVWEVNNYSRRYSHIESDKFYCLQLEENNKPIDFMYLENISDFTGEEFLDDQKIPIFWSFEIPVNPHELAYAYVDPEFASIPG